MICAICLEEINEKNNCTTLCNHKFCLSCMLESLKYKNSCPTCREILYTDQRDNNELSSEQIHMEDTEIIQNFSNEEEESNDNQYTVFISRESIITIQYFLRALYIQQITYNICFGISYGFGVGCGFMSSFLIFYKIFKN